MKIVRYLDSKKTVHYGTLQADGSAIECDGDPFSGLKPTGKKADIAKLLTPIVPIQILCIGLNYRRHAEEMKSPFPEHPILFIKGINTLQNPGDPIILPRHLRSDKVDYECELAVVIGRTCKNVSAKEALIVTPDEVPDPQNLKIRTILNGETVQDWSTGDMIFSVAQIIEFLSGSTTLPAGTVILTGTPHGVGMGSNPPRWLKPGDSVTIDIEKIGSLTNPVVTEPA
ncbi:MAG: DUF2437 domain-containing protein [Verrucomicrobia bacterium]|nr:DUF2437 domain-containing protein [Verrucomicrobiota bacterium]